MLFLLKLFGGSKLGLGIAGLLAVAFIAMATYHFALTSMLRGELTDARRDLGAALTRVAALEGANKQCKEDVEKQNKRVDEWVATMEAAAKAAREAASQAGHAVEGARATSQALRAERSTGDRLKDCERLERNLDAAIQRRMKAASH